MADNTDLEDTDLEDLEVRLKRNDIIINKNLAQLASGEISPEERNFLQQQLLLLQKTEMIIVGQLGGRNLKQQNFSKFNHR